MISRWPVMWACGQLDGFHATCQSLPLRYFGFSVGRSSRFLKEVAGPEDRTAVGKEDGLGTAPASR